MNEKQPLWRSFASHSRLGKSVEKKYLAEQGFSQSREIPAQRPSSRTNHLTASRFEVTWTLPGRLGMSSRLFR